MTGPLLKTIGLTAHYGDFQAMFGVDLTLNAGETLAIIGANGAGKTTLMRSLTGLLPHTSGSIQFKGRPIGAIGAPAVMALGIAMVPEGRRLFSSLTVEENLLIGADKRRGSGYWSLDTVYQLLPVLKERRHMPGTALSGGQQQMVAIGRALMSNPEILLCDEISLGLAPVVIREIYAAVPKIKENGATLIVVEQDIGQAMKVADRVLCMMEGRITLEGRPGVLPRQAIHDAYFGVNT